MAAHFTFLLICLTPSQWWEARMARFSLYFHFKQAGLCRLRNVKQYNAVCNSRVLLFLLLFKHPMVSHMVSFIPHISACHKSYYYLINYLRLYTQDTLKAHKLFDSYNYFSSMRIRDVTFWVNRGLPCLRFKNCVKFECLASPCEL